MLAEKQDTGKCPLAISNSYDFIRAISVCPGLDLSLIRSRPPCLLGSSYSWPPALMVRFALAVLCAGTLSLYLGSPRFSDAA
jgi:hypothetical protein